LDGRIERAAIVVLLVNAAIEAQRPAVEATNIVLPRWGLSSRHAVHDAPGWANSGMTVT
jgi:hypothetical protein